jgi:hypothetical protein
MSLRNRVTPFSELIAVPDRGLVYGNRGCLHDADRVIRRRYAGRRWIGCRLAFRGWARGPMMRPGRFTELFFLDEVTAFAAGHRPCALCRREDYLAFRSIVGGGATPTADEMDAALHAERVDPVTRGQRLHRSRLEELPDGAFIERDGEASLVLGGGLLRWSPSGYAGRTRRGRGAATVLTPPAFVEVLRAGWDPVVPLLHPTASPRAR